MAANATNSPGRTIWNDKTRSDLLQAIIDVAPPTAQEWEAISAQLRAKGYTYNYSAAQQHLQKLKKKEGTGQGSVPATPKKAKSTPKGTPKGGKTPTSGVKRNSNKAFDEDEDEEKILQKKQFKLESSGESFLWQPSLQLSCYSTHSGLTETPSLARTNNIEVELGVRDWRNIIGPDSYLNRFGYWKILKACLLARKDGLKFLWVDTNCIEKTSSAELSEAINSMYAWYRSSAVCYAYLSDVYIKDPTYDGTGDLRGDSLESFRRSRWFRRGWTLQELLAPRKVRFFSHDWTFIGTKKEMASLLEEITRVDKKYLLYAQDIRSASIAQRMAAVADRTTTRPEDIAYCLLGLFNVNMPLLYGEGAMAFVRLQEEIMKVSDDHSIFAWTWLTELTGRITNKTTAEIDITRRNGLTLIHKPNFPVNRVNGLLRNRLRRPVTRPTLLAPDPACFFDASAITTLKPSGSIGIFTMTNAGLSISLPILHHPSNKKLSFAVIHEEDNTKNDTRTAILIPLTPHYQHGDRWTRTFFPVAPVTVVFRKRSEMTPKPEAIQVCRDMQHVSFYFDAFGGTFHRFGFWLLFPQLQETGRVIFNLQDGCVLGDGLYNDHGVFVNPDKRRDEQFIGGLLVFRMDAGMQDIWGWWHGKIIILVLVSNVQRLPKGDFKKTSHHCKILVRPQAPDEPIQLLESFVSSLQQKQCEYSGQSTHVCSDSYKQEPGNMKKYWPLGHQEVTLHATAELLNDESLSHSPESEITLTKLGCWHSEKRARDLKLLGRGFTI
ncbi:HET-domain-containing protein [Xylaria bambusicola]|uniref:HET-domain-containing protein n=1 Tax=Xylaria bambusicola TaxID=326684 RepID=UPI002007444E|nr:HET-domain-containing protein [Xylaria bambusicola]KAI0518308.1 HET-domain-containing protein [Xylaria bambusicola]